MFQLALRTIQCLCAFLGDKVTRACCTSAWEEASEYSPWCAFAAGIGAARKKFMDDVGAAEMRGWKKPAYAKTMRGMRELEERLGLVAK